MIPKIDLGPTCPLFGMTELKIFAEILQYSAGSIYDTYRNCTYGFDWATKAGLAQMTKYFVCQDFLK